MTGSASDPELFGRVKIGPQLLLWLSDVGDAIDKWPADELRTLSNDDLIERLVAEYSLKVPAIHRDRMEVLDPQQLTFRNNGPASGLIHATDHRIAIPFTGPASVFNAQSGRFLGRDTGPRARIDDMRSELVVTLRVLGSQPDDALRNELHRFLEQVQQGLDWAQEEIAKHEGEIRSLGWRIDARRASIERSQAATAALNIPRRQPIASPPPAAPPAPVPAAPAPAAGPAPAPSPAAGESRADFERAISVLARARTYLQKTRSMTEGRGEEDLRDALIYALHVDGAADVTAESLNGSGKTDILVRRDGRSVLIAECKFWDGASKAVDTFDQLSGYVTWDDLYTAIPLFIRGRGDTQAVIDKARQVMRGLSIRCVDEQAEDHWEFVVRSSRGREISVVLMPFVIA